MELEGRAKTWKEKKSVKDAKYAEVVSELKRYGFYKVRNTRHSTSWTHEKLKGHPKFASGIMQVTPPHEKHICMRASTIRDVVAAIEWVATED